MTEFIGSVFEAEVAFKKAGDDADTTMTAAVRGYLSCHGVTFGMLDALKALTDTSAS